jgi:hypothetical protein
MSLHVFQDGHTASDMAKSKNVQILITDHGKERQQNVNIAKSFWLKQDLFAV